MKFAFIIFLIGLVFFDLEAQLKVSSLAELENALKNVRSGDTILLSNGVWEDVQVSLNAFADVDSPIVIKAETAGLVFFQGNSKINIGGAHIHIEGIVFSHPSNLISMDGKIEPLIKFKNTAVCHHCKVSNISVQDYNGTMDQELDTFHWILIYGQYNEVSHSSFVGKKGLGRVIAVVVDSLAPNFAEIHHNYFANRMPAKDTLNNYNGQEAITIGSSATSMSNSHSKVYNNLFHHWSGEIEIVSNKSGANQYYNNTFRDYSGTLTLRHGNNCDVYNNYFFAEKNLLSGGVRVMGEGHRIFNNYIEGVNALKPDGAHSKSTGGINVSNGKPNSKLEEYFQVKNTIIANNTFVHCDYGIQVGTQVKDSLSLPPENLTISNNIFLHSDKKAIREVAEPKGRSLYEGNIAQDGVWDINTGSNQIVDSNLLTPGVEFYRLPFNSPAIDAGIGAFSILKYDILYGDRPVAYDAGCEEYGTKGVSNLPYRVDDVGADIGFRAHSSSGQTKSYSPSAEIIPNPERGLQKYSITSSNYSTTPGANNLSVALLNNWKNSSDKVTVVFRYFLLDDFMASNINKTYLDNIQNDFDNIRRAGLKVIVRFSYSDEEGTRPQQPSKSQILAHISQLGALLNANKDVIFSHQAGFIGTWGEWYYTNSSEFGTEDNITSAQWANRKEVLTAMLAATPVEIPIQVRYVGIKTRLYGTRPLTAQSAYQSTANARIGFYNDAFLNLWGDEGTYSVDDSCTHPVGNSEYNYLSNETQYLPMTGETNGLNPCNNGLRTRGANAVKEMEGTHWTTINRDYYIPFWDQVIASNHYGEIVKKLGYRFVLTSTTVNVHGMDFDLTINLENAGFARVFKERDVYLVMRDTLDNAVTTYLLNTDVRTWENSVSLSQNIDPGIRGTFQLYLWMPDRDSTLAANPDYSIQLANENIWDAATGYNDLMQTVDLHCSPTIGTDIRTACRSYTWIDGKTYTSSNDTAVYTITDGATNGCDSIVVLNLTINNVTDITTTTSGATITANNSSAHYQWLDCLGGYSLIDGETHISFTPSSNGEYAVELTENGCKDTSECVSITRVGVNGMDISDDPFIVFPNPSDEQFFIKNLEKIHASVEIFDPSGKMLIRENLNDFLTTISLDGICRGAFFIQITSAQGRMIKKLIKI